MRDEFAVQEIAVLKYPVVLEPDDNGTILVSFPDFPEAHTFGEDVADALHHAGDALETVLMAYMQDRRDIPAPSTTRKRRFVALPALTEAKIALYQTMRVAGVRKGELARRLRWRLPQVDRLLDLSHSSRLDQIEAALAALKKRLSVHVHDAA